MQNWQCSQTTRGTVKKNQMGPLFNILQHNPDQCWTKDLGGNENTHSKILKACKSCSKRHLEKRQKQFKYVKKKNTGRCTLSGTFH